MMSTVPVSVEVTVTVSEPLLPPLGTATSSARFILPSSLDCQQFFLTRRLALRSSTVFGRRGRPVVTVVSDSRRIAPSRRVRPPRSSPESVQLAFERTSDRMGGA